MKVSVRSAEEDFTFEATAVRTDEHNNLEILGGPRGEKPLGLFNKDFWEATLYGEEVTDGE